MRKFALLAFLLLTGTAAAAPTGVDLSDMDKSVKPGDDFFLYGNGAWIRHAVIPPDRSYAGINSVNCTHKRREH